MIYEKALWDYQSAATSDAPEAFDPEPNYLYRYFNGSGFLLYLGITRHLQDRHYSHAGAVWRPLAEYMFVETFPTRRLVQSAEYRAYKREAPYFNCRIPYQPGFEAVPLAWYGKRTKGRWVGTRHQWFAYQDRGFQPVASPGWWTHGRPQIAEDTFVDPRMAMVMG